MKKKRAYLSGAFDLFHINHLLFIQEGRKIADKHNAILIVGVNTDKHYYEYRGYWPTVPYKYRRKIIEAIKGVDQVVSNSIYKSLHNLKKYKIDYYIIYDQYKDVKDDERRYVESRGGKMYILPKYKTEVSSTQIKKKIKES